MIKVLSTMNLHRELVAFQMGGLSNSQIVRPFIILGAIFSIMILLSYEYIIPNSLNYIDTFKEKKFNISAEKKPFHINHILLSDGSKLIYKSHKPEQQFFDVYWIISLDDIWHIKQLDKSINPPKGHYVDHFLRNEKNELIKKNSYKDYSFPQLNKKNTVKKQALPSCENSAISSLFKRKNIFSTQKEKAEILTYFYYKIIISFTPLLVVISLAPFCMHFSRKISFFLISLISLFLFIFYYSFMNGMIILSENQVIFPSTLLLPFLLPIGYFSIKFFK
jgi:lipopolysaccharide export system permease protein